MTAIATTTARVLDPADLGTGTLIEARRRGEVHYRGWVEDTAAALGVVWIRDDVTGHRAILHVEEYSIRRLAA